MCNVSGTDTYIYKGNAIKLRYMRYILDLIHLAVSDWQYFTSGAITGLELQIMLYIFTPYSLHLETIFAVYQNLIYAIRENFACHLNFELPSTYANICLHRRFVHWLSFDLLWDYHYLYSTLSVQYSYIKLIPKDSPV